MQELQTLKFNINQKRRQLVTIEFEAKTGRKKFRFKRLNKQPIVVDVKNVTEQKVQKTDIITNIKKIEQAGTFTVENGADVLVENVSNGEIKLVGFPSTVHLKNLDNVDIESKDTEFIFSH